MNKKDVYIDMIKQLKKIMEDPKLDKSSREAHHIQRLMDNIKYIIYEELGCD